MCAIGLVLAGKPAILGRAKKVGAFVKSGQKKGSVEIELYRRRKNLVIKRELYENNTSVWYMSGRKTTEQLVVDEIRGLNVQVNNLCQFLAQDRVKEFAKMSAVQLLEETERAVGGERMLELHQTLKSSQEEQKVLTRNTSTMTEELENLKKENDSLEREVKRYQQRQQLVEQALGVKQKLAWTRAANKKDEKDEAQKDVVEQKRRLDELRERVNPDSGPLKRLEGELADTAADIARLRADRRKLETQRVKHHNSLLAILDEYASLEAEASGAEDSRKESEKKITVWESAISKLRIKLNQLPDPKKTGPELAQVTKRVDELQALVTSAQDEERQLVAAQRRQDQELDQKRGAYRRLEDDKRLREEKLRQNQGEFARLLENIRQNPGDFRGKVSGPLCLDMSPHDAVAARMLNTVIPNNTLLTFVVENEDDAEVIRRKAKMSNVYSVSTVCPREPITEAVVEEMGPRAMSDKLKRAGAADWLFNTFSAPLETKYALLTLFPQLSNTVYTTKVLDNIDVIRNTQGIAGLIDPKTQYIFKRSRYGSHGVSVEVKQYQGEAKLLTVGVDPEKKNTLFRELQLLEASVKEARDKLDELSTRNKALTNERRQLETRKRELSDIPATRKALERRIEERGTLIEDERSVDHDKMVLQAEASMTKLRASIAAKVKAVGAAVKEVMDNSLEMDGCTVRLNELEQQIMLLEQQLETEKKEIKEGETELKRLLVVRNAVKKELETLSNIAKKLTPMDEATVARFAAIVQETVAELEQEQINLDQQASSILDVSDNVLRQYEERKKDIGEKETLLAEKTTELELLSKSIVLNKSLWLHGRPEDPNTGERAERGLIKLVEAISVSFKEYMSQIKCHGSVELHKPGDDFANFSIQIKVAFRDNVEASVLSTTFHSGGERSVSTMMYLVSLQPFTPAPFRLVDEINQAMDPVNERRIWEQVVTASSIPSSPQYFLITPKLLPDLTYSESVCVHVVFNGYFNLTQKEWNEGSDFARVEAAAEEDILQDF